MSRITFDSYQERAVGFAIYPDEMKVVYPALGLVGEFGEFCQALYDLIKDVEGESAKRAFLEGALKTLGELGQQAERLKKEVRDQDGATDQDREWALNVRRKIGQSDVSDLLKEMSDSQWYNANFLDDLGVSYGDIADLNIKKLEDRKKRGTLQGSGNDR